MFIGSSKFVVALRAVLVAMIASFLVNVSVSAPATAAVLPACTGVDLLHRPTEDQVALRPFYVEFATGSPLRSGYAGYAVDPSDALFSGKTNLWINVSGFSTADLGLSSNQSADIPVATNSLVAGSNKKLAYVYLTAKAESTAEQRFKVTVSEGKAGTPGSTPICEVSDGFLSIRDIIDASANKLTSVTVSTTTPSIGGTIVVTAKGNTGTIGSGIDADQVAGKGVVALSPSMDDAWPANAFTLTGIQFDLGQTNTFQSDRLRYYPPASNGQLYTVKYYFTVRATKATATPVAPRQVIASGQPVKYTGAFDAAAVVSIQPVTQQLSITKAVSTVETVTGAPANSTNYKISYVVRVQNRSSSTSYLDSVLDTVTVGTGGTILDTPTVSALWDTASVTGRVSIDSATSSRIYFAGPLSIPGLTTKELKYSVTVQYVDSASPKPVNNRAAGQVGDESIAALTGTNVVTLDLANTKQLTLSPNGATSLVTSETTTAGVLCAAPDSSTSSTGCNYYSGSVVTIKAEPPAGFTLSGWTVTYGTGDTSTLQTTCTTSTTTNPCQIAMNESATIQPIFTAGKKITVTNVGDATITDGTNVPFVCSGIGEARTCEKTYPAGSSPTLTVTPGGSETVTAVTDSATALNAPCTTTCVLKPLSNDVTLSLVRQSTIKYGLIVESDGSGTVDASVGLIQDCATSDTSTVCSDSYAPSTSVTLTASPPAGWRVKSWSGANCGTALTCVVSMTSDKLIAVVFELIPTDNTPAPNPTPIREVPSTDPTSPQVLPPSNTTGTDPGQIPVGNLPPNSNLEIARDRLPSGINDARINNGVVEYTPAPGFSGNTVVPLLLTQNGVQTIILVPVTVNPVAPISGQFTPTTATNTNLGWRPSPNAIGYRVFVNGRLVCETTSAVTCNVRQILGPKAKITVVALGNDGTVSKQTLPVYAPERPIPVLTVNFAVDSFRITPTAKRRMDAFVKMMREQGFTRVVIEGHTDNQGGARGAQALSRNRARVVAAYLDQFLNVSFAKSQFGEKRPTAPNTTSRGQAANRRATGAVW